MGYTYGMELEAVDMDRSKVILPEGCTWASKEVTLVNSNGVAVDSRKKALHTLGGEINTPATKTLDDQQIVAERCCKVLKRAGGTVNYRCNTQAHVGNWQHPTNEAITLSRLKKVQAYAFNYYDRLLMLTMGSGQFNKKPEYPPAFWSHYKERMVPEWKHKYLLQATSLDGFRKAMFFNKAGTHAPMTFMRQGINTHSFFKTGTVEFRLFWATLDPDYIQTILEFCKLFMDDALGKQDSFDDLERYYYGKFPLELPFDAELEAGFQRTKVEKPS